MCLWLPDLFNHSSGHDKQWKEIMVGPKGWCAHVSLHNNRVLHGELHNEWKTNVSGVLMKNTSVKLLMANWLHWLWGRGAALALHTRTWCNDWEAEAEATVDVKVADETTTPSGNWKKLQVVQDPYRCVMDFDSSFCNALFKKEWTTLAQTSWLGCWLLLRQYY